jgi:hypothetical protein
MKLNIPALENVDSTVSLCPGGGVAILTQAEGFDRMLAFCKDDSNKLSLKDTNWDWIHKSFRGNPRKSKK